MSIVREGIGQSRSSKRRRRKKAESGSLLYEQYLADSGSDSDAVDAADGDVLLQEVYYSVGMDINILIRQTVQNVVQSVVLDGAGREVLFGDHELVCFAAAVKHNVSILSIQIKFLDVTDISLVALCEALKQHPTLRALDIVGTQGGHATSTAIRQLVCTNPSIIYANVEESFLTPSDADLIGEAVQYNAMVCPDPSSHPFQLGLLRKFSALEEEEKKYMKSLEPKPWMLSCERPTMEESASFEPTNHAQQKRRNKTSWNTTTGTKIGAEPCPNYMKGGCSFGSRCKFFHPEYTPAISNAVQLSQFEQGNRSISDGASTMMSTATSNLRLQSRLRPSHFTLQKRKMKSHIVIPNNNKNAPVIESKAFILSVWLMSASLAATAVTLLLQV